MKKPFGYWNKPIAELAIIHNESDANGENGYIRVSRNNIIYYLHIIIWIELVGPIPDGYTIDHINGIKTDCNLENLRCVPEVINRRNVGKRSDNITGITGVSYWKAGNAFRASGYNPITNKQVCKTFSINKYGYDISFQLASEARSEMLIQFNALGAGYTERHGK